ncbi:MAG: DapH/DapD/GlmU-related protein [bacterium]
MFRWNPQGDYPQIDNSAYIDPTAVIIGKVSIGRDAFVGPTAVIRADEPGSSIIIKDNCNVQDRVIIHALEGTSVEIDKNTSLSHGCIIHGPCKIGKNCFIGFGSVVFKSEIGEKSLIKHLAVVEKVDVSSGRMVESGQLVNCEDDARELRCADEGDKAFMEKVIKVNLNLVKGYNDSQRGTR